MDILYSVKLYEFDYVSKFAGNRYSGLGTFRSKGKNLRQAEEEFVKWMNIGERDWLAVTGIRVVHRLRWRAVSA